MAVALVRIPHVLVRALMSADDKVSNPIGMRGLGLGLLAVLIIGIGVYYGTRGARKRR